MVDSFFRLNTAGSLGRFQYHLEAIQNKLENYQWNRIGHTVTEVDDDHYVSRLLTTIEDKINSGHDISFREFNTLRFTVYVSRICSIRDSTRIHRRITTSIEKDLLLLFEMHWHFSALDQLIRCMDLHRFADVPTRSPSLTLPDQVENNDDE